MTGEEFMEHVVKEHGFGGTGDTMNEALGLTSPATRAYHDHLHETREFNHTHGDDQ